MTAALRRNSILAALFAAIFWGGSFPIVKFGLRFFKPLWFLDLRLVLAFLAMFVFLQNKRNFWRFPKEIWWLGALNAAGYIFQYFGMERTTAGKAAFFVNINVVFVVFLAHFFFKEKLQWEKYGAMILMLVGIYLLSTKGAGVTDLFHGSTFGNLLVLSAGISWAFFIIVAKKILDKPSSRVFRVVTAYVFTTIIFVTPIAMIFEPFPGHFGATEITILSVTALFFTVVPFYFWSVSLRGLTATLTSFLTLSETIFALILSVAFLGERLQPVEMVGAFLLLLSIFAASVR